MTFRFHINNKITDEGGGDTSRTVDIEAENEEDARAQLEASEHPLADHEEIEQINEVHLTPPVVDIPEMHVPTAIVAPGVM